jgi:hypothetical protein
LYPVVDRFDKIRIITDDDDDDDNDGTTGNNNIENRVVAMLSAGFYWRDVLKNVLPDGRKGVVVVVENQCTAPFTYQVE